MIKTLSVALIHSTHSMEALSSLLFSLSGCKMPSSILLPYVPRLGNINKWTSLAFTHSPVFWVCAQQKTESHLWISQSLELRKPDCKIIFHPTSWRNHSGRSCGQLKHWYRSCFGISEDNFVMTLWGKNETLWATLHITPATASAENTFRSICTQQGPITVEPGLRSWLHHPPAWKRWTSLWNRSVEFPHPPNLPCTPHGKLRRRKSHFAKQICSIRMSAWCLAANAGMWVKHKKVGSDQPSL